MNRRNFFGKVLGGVVAVSAGKSIVTASALPNGGLITSPPTNVWIGECANRAVNPEFIAPMGKIKVVLSGHDLRTAIDRSNKIAGAFLN